MQQTTCAIDTEENIHKKKTLINHSKIHIKFNTSLSIEFKNYSGIGTQLRIRYLLQKYVKFYPQTVNYKAF